MWIILLFPMNCVSTLSCRPLKLFPGSSLATCRLYYVHVQFVQTRATQTPEMSGLKGTCGTSKRKMTFVAHLSTSSSLDEVTRATTELDVSVDSAAEHFVLRDSGVKNIKSPWFDNDCLNAKNAARKSLQIFRKTSLEGDRLNFIQNKRTYRQLIRDRKKKHKQNLAEKLHSTVSEPKAFWKELRTNLGFSKNRSIWEY